MTQSDRGESGFNRIGGPQVTPVLGWEVVERQQDFSVLGETLAGSGVLGLVFLNEFIECFFRLLLRSRLADLMQICLRFRLHALGHLVEDVGRLMNPTPLLSGLRVDFTKRGPEAHRSVTNCQLWSNNQPSVLKIQEQLSPALFALSITVQDRDQFLPAVSSGAH